MEAFQWNWIDYELSAGWMLALKWPSMPNGGTRTHHPTPKQSKGTLSRRRRRNSSSSSTRSEREKKKLINNNDNNKKRKIQTTKTKPSTHTHTDTRAHTQQSHSERINKQGNKDRGRKRQIELRDNYFRIKPDAKEKRKRGKRKCAVAIDTSLIIIAIPIIRTIWKNELWVKNGQIIDWSC